LLIAVGLAAVGAAVAVYLAADQVGAIARAWDPIFGSASSQRVLHSWLSRSLPLPDAALGAAGYVGELVLIVALLLGARGGRHPWLGLAYGALAMSMAVVGVALVAIQALSLGTFCSLCLVSAAVSWVIAALAFPMLASGIRELASEVRSARST
jgi:uncharacterized membrane protein